MVSCFCLLRFNWFLGGGCFGTDLTCIKGKGVDTMVEKINFSSNLPDAAKLQLV